MIKYKIRGSDWLTFPLVIVNFNHFFIQPATDGAVNAVSEAQALTSATFTAYVENIFYLYPEVFAGLDFLKCFRNFCRTKGYRFSASLLSNRTSCRSVAGNFWYATMAKTL